MGVLEPCSWLILQTVQEGVRTAQLDNMDVQMPALIYQAAEDDEIYMLNQICTAPFSNSRSILSHPVWKDKEQIPSLIRVIYRHTVMYKHAFHKVQKQT